MDLPDLPRLMPRAIAWAETVAALVASAGEPLDASDLLDAKAVGVQNPGIIRVSTVELLPLPSDAELREAALQMELLGPSLDGLTLGHSILIRHGRMSRRLLSHECRHVFQYEQAGSIAAFLPLYLQTIVQAGYWDSPFEKETRAHELADTCRSVRPDT